MKRRHLTGLILISFLLCNAVAYVDEGLYSFNYLTHAADWVALLMYTVLFLILPLVLYFSGKRSKKRFSVALIGFTPVLLLLLLQVR